MTRPEKSGEAANHPISDSPRESAANKPRNPNWGGKRSGAGAPKGNLNALKHGRRSRQFAEIGAILATHDSIRTSLLALADRRRFSDHKAEIVAADLLVRLFQHAKDVAAGRDSPGPFREVARSNEAAQGLTAAQSRQLQRQLNAAVLKVFKETE
jgi:hypothetical protein